MATVVSLTEAKIQELMAGWESVGLSQDEINSLVAQLWSSVQTQKANLENFNEVVLPALEADLAAGSLSVDALAAQIPALQDRLDETQLSLDALNNTVIPLLQEELTANIINVVESPQVYVQPDAPENPDANERYLVVGDVWHDSDDDNKQLIWNGAEWSTFGVDIPDFSLTVKKFNTSTHMIY